MFVLVTYKFFFKLIEIHISIRITYFNEDTAKYIFITNHQKPWR